MKALSYSVPLVFLVLVFFVACDPQNEVGDDDDSGAAGDDDDSGAAGDDDDSSSGGDDDDAASSCEVPLPPYDLVFSGATSLELAVSAVDCRDLSGDNWSVNYVNEQGWDIRFTAGPLVEGETLSQGISITVQNNAESLSFSGRTQTGHQASVDVQSFSPSEGRFPCGNLQTVALSAPGADGGSLELLPSPLPFHCTSGN